MAVVGTAVILSALLAVASQLVLIQKSSASSAINTKRLSPLRLGPINFLVTLILISIRTACKAGSGFRKNVSGVTIRTAYFGVMCLCLREHGLGLRDALKGV